MIARIPHEMKNYLKLGDVPKDCGTILVQGFLHKMIVRLSFHQLVHCLMSITHDQLRRDMKVPIKVMKNNKTVLSQVM